ncbi:MAG: hypothetical protein ACYS0E_03695 [Planctomycetota bacterium]
MTPNGTITNRRVAWTGMAVGAALGMILGLWSFDGPAAVPGFLGAYDDTARRLMRLGHIAFFGLGFINLLLARELPSLPKRVRRIAGRAMNIGNLGLPLTLVIASMVPPIKYLMPIPASAVLLALVLVAHGVRHDHA